MRTALHVGVLGVPGQPMSVAVLRKPSTRTSDKLRPTDNMARKPAAPMKPESRATVSEDSGKRGKRASDQADVDDLAIQEGLNMLLEEAEKDVGASCRLDAEHAPDDESPEEADGLLLRVAFSNVSNEACGFEEEDLAADDANCRADHQHMHLEQALRSDDRRKAKEAVEAGVSPAHLSSKDLQDIGLVGSHPLDEADDLPEDLVVEARPAQLSAVMA